MCDFSPGIGDELGLILAGRALLYTSYLDMLQGKM
jgi:hypothetical protein